MEEKQVTLKELVEITIDDLKALSIPATMLDQFGPTISRVLRNLNIVADAFNKAEQQQKETIQEEAKTEDEPEIEIVE